MQVTVFSGSWISSELFICTLRTFLLLSWMKKFWGIIMQLEKGKTATHYQCLFSFCQKCFPTRSIRVFIIYIYIKIFLCPFIIDGIYILGCKWTVSLCKNLRQVNELWWIRTSPQHQAGLDCEVFLLCSGKYPPKMLQDRTLPEGLCRETMPQWVRAILAAQGKSTQY